MKRLETMKNPVAMSTPISKKKKTFSDKRNRDSLGKWLILGLGQKMNKVSLEYLAMTESKDVIKDYEIVSQRTQVPS